MASISNLDILPPKVRQRSAAKLLAISVPYLIHCQLAEKYDYPENQGDILVSRRYNKFAPVPTPLDMVTNPPSQLQTYTDVRTQIYWYGTNCIVTRDVEATNEDPVLNRIIFNLGVCWKETEDIIMRKVMEGVSSFVNCTGGSNGDSPTNVSDDDIDDFVTTLTSRNASFVTDMISARDLFGTGPVPDAYVCMAHSDILKDLRRLEGWQNKSRYPNVNGVKQFEYGQVENIRYWLSAQGSIADELSAVFGSVVYNMMITGQESYGKVDYRDTNSGFYLNRPGGHSDPNHLRAIAAFTLPMAGVMQNTDWFLKARCTLSS